MSCVHSERGAGRGRGDDVGRRDRDCTSNLGKEKEFTRLRDELRCRREPAGGPGAFQFYSPALAASVSTAAMFCINSCGKPCRCRRY